MIFGRYKLHTATSNMMPILSKWKRKNKNNKIWWKTIFNMADRILTPCKCGTIMTLISLGDCNVACGSGIVTVNSPSGSSLQLWYVAMWWHAMEFAQTSAILEFYIMVSISTTSPQSTCHSAPVSEIIFKTTLGRKNDVMSIFKMADLRHLGFYGSNNGLFEKPMYDFL